MQDLALYRKYRPQTFKEVLGQEHIVSVLEASVQLGKVAHAYVFSGSRGTGKTSIARIFAREVGCSVKDLYEIDAATYTSVENIRQLNEGVHTMPFESERKVYILDEAHMLSKSAFNALLKTLEEPPRHVVFILATTEADRLPETVLSRCQVFHFRKPSQPILAEMVAKVAKKEGFTLEPASAELVALLGDGSFRDTHSILQKVLSSSPDKKISIAEVEAVTGAPQGTLVNKLVTAIADKNVENGLSALQEASKLSIDMVLFSKLLLAKLRAALLLKAAPKAGEDMLSNFPESDAKVIRDAAGKAGISSTTLSTFLTAAEAVPRAYIPELPLEVAVVEVGK